MAEHYSGCGCGTATETCKGESLTISKERVLEAASKCPQAKETLKTLWPEVFQVKKTALGKAIRDGAYVENDGISPAPYDDYPKFWNGSAKAAVEFLLGRVNGNELSKIAYRFDNPDACASEILSYLRREFEAVL